MKESQDWVLSLSPHGTMFLGKHVLHQGRFSGTQLLFLLKALLTWELDVLC